MRKLWMYAALSASVLMFAADSASARGGRRSCGSSCGSGCGSSYSHCGSGCGSSYYTPHYSSCGSCSTGHCGISHSAPVHHGAHCPTCVGYGAAPSAPVYAVAPTAATLVVTLPDDARLTIDGQETTVTSGTRTFASPALPTGQDFVYTLEATVARDGKTEKVSKEVIVRAGETTVVSLKFSGQDVASK
jgi:uncharacterized protein (TIGR03000 family)